ncbi:unnamed protein product [Ambrosiozyma monospora]|uniref:Unnamed protein product n=1 Tax=Ambrosiozyma monospora TaxID=43982 RepID=A0ACB5SX36_AMBMO|nr:unnamed protein product [Ambrosiozyma monospora]
MKFSSILSLLSLSVLSVHATEDEQTEQTEQKPIIEKQTFTPTDEKPFNFRITYGIDSHPQPSAGASLAVHNSEIVKVHYNFTNFETEEVSIVGVGGQMWDPVTGEVKANVTATNIGPLAVGSEGSVDFIQQVGIDLEPDVDYLFVPAIYIIFQEKLLVLGSTNTLVHVSDVEVSAFDPKFLILVVVLLATLAGVGYAVFEFWGKEYLIKYLAKNEGKKLAKAGVGAALGKATGSSSGSDWLPETHLNLKKK